MTGLLAAISAGFSLALAFNPVVAAPTSAIAAAIASRAGGLGRAVFAVAVVALGWLLGDGMRVIASGRDLYDGVGSLLPGAPLWANVTALVVWGAGGLLLGYVFPAWAGAFVGRRVTWGTGFIAAAVVAAACSAAVATFAGAVG